MKQLGGWRQVIQGLLSLLGLLLWATGCGSTASPPKVTLSPTTTPVGRIESIRPNAPSLSRIENTRPPTSPVAQASALQPNQALPSSQSEILFLRAGNLQAYGLETATERQIASAVHEFAPSPAGRQLALIRGKEGSREVWLIDRDGQNLRLLTSNSRAESNLTWAADGLRLAYTSAQVDPPKLPTWESWSRWCGPSEIYLLNLPLHEEKPLGAGCMPAFSPDGKRLAFTTPPETTDEPGNQTKKKTNALRLVNSKGQNGWNLATAGQTEGEDGRLVYAPVWSPDGLQIVYQRFRGYQVLVDLNLTERRDSVGKTPAKLLGTGLGWMLPPVFAPDGERLGLVAYNDGNARGVKGYEMWAAEVLKLGEQGSVSLPEGSLEADAVLQQHLNRVTALAWSPDSKALVVALPKGWQPGIPPAATPYEAVTPGELWLWQPAKMPTKRLVEGVDYASPLVWLP